MQAYADNVLLAGSFGVGSIIGPIGRMRRWARPNALRPGKLRGSTDKLEEEIDAETRWKDRCHHRWKLWDRPGDG
jgi:hypothetical protein